jgi:hypothetical protein
VFNTGVGLTVIVNIIGGPRQPLAAGVIVITADIGSVVLFVVVNEGILLPVPPAARPIEVLLLDQVKVVPGTGPEIFIAGAEIPLQ